MKLKDIGKALRVVRVTQHQDGSLTVLIAIDAPFHIQHTELHVLADSITPEKL